jgi:hypothetical protein
VVARGRQRGHRFPAVRRRVIGFHGPGIPTIRADAADRIDLSVEKSHGQRATGGRQGAPLPPVVSGRVVLIENPDRTEAPTVPADKIKLPIQRHGTGMMKALGQGGPSLPAVGGGVIDLDQITAGAKATDHIDAPCELSHRDFSA